MLLVSEGPTDVGDPERRRFGALRVLVRRVLEEHWKRDVDEWEIETGYLPRVHALSAGVSGFERKVELAIIEAEIRDCSTVVIVVDQDGAKNKARIQLLEAGRARALSNGHALAHSATVGVAVQTLETWLLADELALNQVLAPSPQAGAVAKLEELHGAKGTSDHPKTVLRQIIGSASNEIDSPYDSISSAIRLAILEQRCPRGFAALAKELRARCK